MAIIQQALHKANGMIFANYILKKAVSEYDTLQ